MAFQGADLSGTVRNGLAAVGVFPKWNKKTVFGYHYQLAPKTRMSQLSFARHLDNMARAAIVQQIAAAKSAVKV